MHAQLIPHADVLFLNRHYAQAQSPAYASAPRAFLLALTRLAPPHALLVAYWGAEGAAALSVPTREYFQSSGWTGPSTPVVATSSSSSISPSCNTTPSAMRHHHHLLHQHNHHNHVRNGVEEAQSVRSGSGFWAAGHDSSQGSSAFSASQLRQLSGRSGLSASACASGSAEPHADDSGDDSDGTEIAAGSSNDGSRVAHGGSSSAQQAGQPQQQQQGQQGQGQQLPLQQQQQQTQQQTQTQRAEDVGAHDAFIAGMIYALSRRLLPGAPYAPGLSGATEAQQRSEGGRWKLDECLRCVLRAGPGLLDVTKQLKLTAHADALLYVCVCVWCRFATELAGRKARRHAWDGLGEEMARAGWFDG